MAAELNTTKFEKFISDYPIYEYRLLDAKALSVAERVRIVCQQEFLSASTPEPVHRRLGPLRNVRTESTVMTVLSFFPA